MEDQVCLVTGANTGIGLETARALADRGATVVMAARNVDKGRAAVDDVGRSTGSDRVELLELDLSSTASTRRAAASFLDRHEKLHVLVNNAGLILSDFETTEDGFEATFGVNHLGHFLLTWLLLDRLQQSAPARIVNVSSEAHRSSRGLDFDDLNRERRSYSSLGAYADSKLANILFTRELARRFEGTGVVAHAVHPGVVSSGFARDGDTRGAFRWLVSLATPFMIDPTKGARTTIHVATASDPASPSGDYWVRRKRRRPSRHGRNDLAARQLWNRSVEMLGLDAVARPERAGT